jgi:hypothetical protein
VGATIASVSADDAGIRAELQAKYDKIDSEMNAGDLAAFRKLAGSSYVYLDIQKHSTKLAELVRVLNLKRPQKFETRTIVESADTLDGKAKAALRITIKQTVIENGKAVTYEITKSQEDTWFSTGVSWKLVGTRLTSNLVIRNGKTIVNEREHVPTDWDRNYRRRSSSRRGG